MRTRVGVHAGVHVCISTRDNIPADCVSLFRLICPHLSSFPSPWVTISTASLLSSITDPFVPPPPRVSPPTCFTVITSLVHDHPSPSHPLVPHLCPNPPTFAFAGGSQLSRQWSREIACYRGSIFQAHLNCFVLTLCQTGVVKVARATRRPPWSHL